MLCVVIKTLNHSSGQIVENAYSLAQPFRDNAPRFAATDLQVTKVVERRLMQSFFCHSRTTHETSETQSFAEREEQSAGREETQDGLQRRTTG